jgi:meso-butanediol dehydrogenase / (S,S)-butanediol dehydrogenase / diacetyl reductase
MARFEDKVALVTGASSGIGAATAGLLAAEGATVVGLDLAGDGEGVLRTDVTDPGSVAAAVDTVVERHGRLDLAINCAGIMRFGRIEEIDVADWQRHLAVNLTGPFLVSQAAIPHLLETKGSIVSVASIAGVKGQAYTSAYCASKGGVVLFTKSLALELASRGVRVNCVCPGGVDTPLIMGALESMPADAERSLMARLDSVIPGMVQPTEVAEAIAYLASDAARMITGTALMLDGGTMS